MGSCSVNLSILLVALRRKFASRTFGYDKILKNSIRGYTSIYDI